MQVEIKLHGNLRQYRPKTAVGAPHHPFWLTVPENISLQWVVTQLQIPDGLVNAASLNGEAVELDAPLQDNDKVQLFAPSAGG